MATNKNCGCGYVQTGFDSCSDYFKQIVGVGLIKTFADDGTRNGIDTSVALGNTYFQDLINNSDPSKRLYYFGGLQNVQILEGDARTESFTDGTTVPLEKFGTSTFAGIILGLPWQKVRELTKGFCNDWSYYAFDLSGAVLGVFSGDVFYPREILDGTVKFKNRNNGDTAAATGADLTFTEKKTALNTSIDALTISDVSFAQLSSVKEIVFSEITPATSGVIKLSSYFIESAKGEDGTYDIQYDEANVADWTLTDTTASSALTIDSVNVAEVGGVCEISIAYSGGVASNTYTLDFTKNGFYANSVTGTQA